MKRWSYRFIYLLACLAGSRLEAEIISWFSDANQTNLDSSGTAMGSGFQFQLGVFSDGFAPTARNTSEWLAHWHAADTTTYNAANQRFADSYQVTANTAPFIVGAAAWIFGHRDSPTGSEWILFRKATWLWPAPNPMNPLPTQWNAKNADVIVLGSVNGSGSPFLMHSAGFQTYNQWQVEYLTGDPLDGPDDDPDEDGTPNLLEFVFGSPPKVAGPPPATPVTMTSGHRQISIPRLIGRPAKLTVEVSTSLTGWQSGPAVTETVSDGPEAWIVRDLTPAGPGQPRRFMRLKVETAAP